jgi:hypothetical protein
LFVTVKGTSNGEPAEGGPGKKPGSVGQIGPQIVKMDATRPITVATKTAAAFVHVHQLRRGAPGGGGGGRLGLFGGAIATFPRALAFLRRLFFGIYQHMDKKHLGRYLAEFDFRHNTRAKLGIDDVQRTAIAVQGFKGKRLTYQTAH